MNLLAQANPVVNPSNAKAPVRLVELETLFGNLTRFIIPLAGVVLFVVLIMGGFQYITSGGDPKKAEGAKSTITMGLSGIILLAFGYFILVLIARFTGQTGILKFIIYQP